MSILSLVDVEKIYVRGAIKVSALKKVSLEIEEGDFVAIVGPSGSGKSTLLNVIGGLDRPTSGKIILKGEDLSELSEDDLARIRMEEIGFIFQQYNLIHTMDSLENVSLPLYFAGVGKKKRLEKAKLLLEQMGLGDRLYHKPNELSGGEQQRVAIARALVNNPKIILGDEPTGNIDSQAGTMIIDILKELNMENRTIIIVTHDMEIAKKTQYIIRMKDGMIIN
ncbi:ABC transporter ATP-binding protein [Candidatus Methanoliparum sp. LAM-1]|uniref:ABC transporter ATP-binding protein n=1 Tax=Candidatus Methanoliparum sp. LAM-1 TaxID=2874846 RepID=UPI001E2EB1E2|nr:ABC transporter ATP-binding protein [Candidatus Methanoliparum sp. LAM-1]BDC36121.1 putative ABC transporter ATP-binding protein [Candidatus Methanoliparum sp. LAM-1]